MSKWDGSTGTLVFLPNASAEQDLQVLCRAGLHVVADDDWHDPLRWLSERSDGLTIRVMRRHLRGDRRATWGGIDWRNTDQRESVLAFAERAAMSIPNRWFAVCDYEGWEDDCRSITVHADLADFRRLLGDNGPGEGEVHKVMGPALLYGE